MIAKIVRGRGFRGAVNYGLNVGKNAIEGKEAVLIGGNMTGTTAKELAAEFKQCRKLRPEVSRPVWMESLRPEGTVDLTPEQWNELANNHMKRIGLDPANHMHTIFQHPQENHIHIVASRISIDGDLYLGKNEHLIASKDCRQIEKDYGLQQLPEKPTKDRKTPTKPEIEMANRTGELPPRVRLQNIIDKSLTDQPTQAIFETRLAAEGVSVKKTGFGFSFAIDDVAFPAADLGKAYSTANLKKRFGIKIEKPVVQEQPKSVDQVKALFAARNAERQTEQQRRSRYRSNRYTIRSTGQIVSRILPKPLGLSIELAAEIFAAIAAINDWTQAQVYKRHVKDLTDKLNQVKVKPLDIVVSPKQPKVEITTLVEPKTEKIQEIIQTPDLARLADPGDAAGSSRNTTYSSESTDQEQPKSVDQVQPPIIQKPVVSAPPAQSEALPLLSVKETNLPIQQPASDSVVKAVVEPPAPAFTADDLRQIASLSYNIHKTTEERQVRIAAEITKIWEAAGRPGKIIIDYEGEPLTINDVSIKELVANLPQEAPKPVKEKSIKC